MDDVAVDAKRILLRYGAPIDVLDEVGEVERIELARFTAKTPLPERERRLHQELADRGYMEPPTVKTRKSRAKAAQRPAAQGPKPSAAKGGTSAKSKQTPQASLSPEDSGQTQDQTQNQGEDQDSGQIQGQDQD